MIYFKDNADGWYVLHESVTYRDGLIQVTKAEYDAANTHVPTQAEQFKVIERAIEHHMDVIAQSDNWDNRWTCVARSGYVNPWQAKAVKFGQWMDSCWAIAIQAQTDVIAGTRTIPTPEQAVAEFPAMVW